jgi:DNA-binding transcriptional regulator YiaG
MTGEQYQDAIDRLGMTQVGSARFFRVDHSTVRRWIAGNHEVPEAISLLLRVMIAAELTPHHVLAIDASLDKDIALEAADA